MYDVRVGIGILDSEVDRIEYGSWLKVEWDRVIEEDAVGFTTNM